MAKIDECIYLCSEMMKALNGLSLKSVQDWENGLKIATGLMNVKKSLESMKQDMEVCNHEKNNSQ